MQKQFKNRPKLCKEFNFSKVEEYKGKFVVAVWWSNLTTDLIDQTIKLATKFNKPVHFVVDEYNISMFVKKSDTRELVLSTYKQKVKEYKKTPEFKAKVAKWKQDKKDQEVQKHKDFLTFVRKLNTGTESELRDLKAQWPHSLTALNTCIKAVTDREHTYGTAAYAMSLAAEVAFNYVGAKEGTTGFQASCATLDLIKRLKNIEGPYSILDYSDLLFPQSNRFSEIKESLNDPEMLKWFKAEAKKKLKESVKSAHPNVKKHWRRLANGERPWDIFKDQLR